MTGSPTAPRSDHDRVRILERRLGILERELFRRREAVASWPKVIHLATTTKTSTYPPAPADTFEIAFANGTFTETEGNRTATLTSRKSVPQRIAHSLGGIFYPEGAKIYVAEIDRKYWIVGGEWIARSIEFALSAALLQTNASVAASVTQYLDGKSPGASITLYNRPASTSYIFWGDSGDKGKASWSDVLGRYVIDIIECD